MILYHYLHYLKSHTCLKRVLKGNIVQYVVTYVYCSRDLFFVTGHIPNNSQNAIVLLIFMMVACTRENELLSAQIN